MRKATTTKAFLGEFYLRHHENYPFYEVIEIFHILTLLIHFALTLGPQIAQIAGRLQKLDKNSERKCAEQKNAD